MLTLQAKKNSDHPGKRLIIQAISLARHTVGPQSTAICSAIPLGGAGSHPSTHPATVAMAQKICPLQAIKY
jgi:hypothetical protein